MARLLPLLQRVAGLLAGLVLLAIAFVYASILVALAAAFALVIGAWLWWRTRALRSQAARAGGVVIEGEFRVEGEKTRLDDARS